MRKLRGPLSLGCFSLAVLNFFGFLLFQNKVTLYLAFGLFSAASIIAFFSYLVVLKQHRQFLDQLVEALNGTLTSTGRPIKPQDSELLAALSRLKTGLDFSLSQPTEAQKIETSEPEEPINYIDLLSQLSFFHIPDAIKDKWLKFLNQEWEKTSLVVLNTLDNIKQTNEEDREFIGSIKKEYGNQQANLNNYAKDCQNNFENYISRSKTVKQGFLENIDYSTSRIKETFESFVQVAEIAERIKLISLNMSIEASKVKGSQAFSYLARELRKLAEYTEQTLHSIQVNIKTTLDTMKSNSDKQINDFAEITETVSLMKDRIIQFIAKSGTIDTYLKNTIGKLEKNHGQQREKLLQFFEVLQRMVIVRDEHLHTIQFLNELFLKASSILKDKDLIGDFQIPDSFELKKDIFELLGRYMHTDGERKLMNELSLEHLNIDREKLHGSIEKEAFIRF